MKYNRHKKAAQTGMACAAFSMRYDSPFHPAISKNTPPAICAGILLTL